MHPCCVTWLSSHTLQVIWQPYLQAPGREFRLNSMCRRDRQLWRIRCPLICIFAVEWHIPHRVAEQFDVIQRIPPDDVYTGGLALHQWVLCFLYNIMSLKFMWLCTHFLYFLFLLICRINRQTYNHIVDWTVKHQEYVDMWADRENRKETDMVLSTYETV